ncbi:hypothetical protein BLFGPEAP_02900 [Candidatus Methanoperedenaceae archaeon GB50]|nr:hypothetical protein BLFGPEAP_02900 [Candidatus Methanoperedenaceae archaeon GB50]
MQLKERNIKVMVTMDHYTPVTVRTHIGETCAFCYFFRKEKSQLLLGFFVNV